MTYPFAYPPSQGYSGPPNPQYPSQVAHGSVPAGVSQNGATYGRASTPTGHGAYMSPTQSVIPTQSVLHPPGTLSFSGQPHPPAPVQVSALQYQPYQPYQPQQQQFQQFQ